MGLLNNVTLLNGLFAPNAYHRIENVSGNKSNLAIQVNSYISQQAYNEGVAPLDAKLYNFVPDTTDTAVNFIKQGYEHLKTLPEFIGAIDV